MYRENGLRELEAFEQALLYVVALALPWGLFQSAPLLDVTLVKLAGAGLILVACVRGLIERSPGRFRTGIEVPLALFLAACAVHTFHSLDRAASLHLLFTYASYVALFYATFSAVRTTATAQRLAHAFVLSSACVGAVSLLCAGGLLTPTQAVRIGEALGRPYWRLNTLRLVTASADFNEGVLPLLLAFVLLLFMGRPPWVGSGWWRVRHGLAPLLVLPLVIAMSRSALAVAAILALVALVTLPSAKARWRLLPVIGAGLIAMAYFAWPYLEATWSRVAGITTLHTDAESGRLFGVLAAVEVGPSYALLGAGLGAVDAALAASRHAPHLAGLTLHNVPLKLGIELGLVGLAAFLWLWARPVRIVHRSYGASQEAFARRLGLAFVAAAFAAFWILNVQPLLNLSLFPFALGVALGPARLCAAAPAPSETAGPKRAAALASLLVCGVVIWNVAAYERTVVRVGAFKHGLERAALQIAEGQDGEACVTLQDLATSLDGATIWALPFYENAAALLQLDKVYAEAGLGRRSRDLNPFAATLCLLGQSLTRAHREEDAAEPLHRAIALCRGFAAAEQALGDALWELGEPLDALAAYRRAAQSAASPANAAYAVARELRLAQAARLLRSYKPPSPKFIEAATILRREGAWDQALPLYERAHAAASRSMHVLYALGAAAEEQGDHDAAARLYREAQEAELGCAACGRALARIQPTQ